MSNPYQPQDPYSKNPYGEQPAPPPPPGYGYPQPPSAPQDPYLQDPYGQQPPPDAYGYPQPGYPMQPPPGYAGYGGFTGENNGMATAAMVVGIVSLVGICFFGWILGVVAVGLGIGGLNRSKVTGTSRGQAIAGIATGGAAILFGVVLLIFLIASGTYGNTY